MTEAEKERELIASYFNKIVMQFSCMVPSGDIQNDQLLCFITSIYRGVVNDIQSCRHHKQEANK